MNKALKIILLSVMLTAAFAVTACSNNNPKATDTAPEQTTITIPTETTEEKSEYLENGLEYVIDSDISCHIVGQGLFRGENLVIPESDSEGRIISYIAGYAFKNNTDIVSLKIEGKLNEIKGGAFQGCTSLKSVILPESLKKIGPFSFYGDSALESIFIPSRVETIGQNAFSSCSSLTKFEVDAENANFKAESGVLYSSDMKSLLIYPIGKSDKEFTVPEGVERINNSAFEYCLNIESLICSQSLTEIDDHAFRYCTNLKSVKLFEAFHRMGGGCFYSCKALTTIYYAGSKEMWEKKDSDDKEYVQLANTWKENAGSCTIVYEK